MRVLHLFSNSKWTGPAEPALNLCLALRKRGVEADFACAPGSGRTPNKIVETARDGGIEPLLSLSLNKHRHPIRNALDRRRLTKFLRTRRWDLVHCHLDNDHRIASRPARRLGIPLVRSNYNGEGFENLPSARRLVSGADFLIEPSQRAFLRDSEGMAMSPERMRVVPGAVDTERFDPSRQVPDGRRRLSIPPEAFVVGIVARMQLHRKFEVFWEALARLVGQNDGVHAIVVGRGTNQKAVGTEPVANLGLEERVHFAGYVEGEDYVGMLKAFDVKVFLMPGSDGTCRAVREAMAMAKPVIVADRGMLPEIVEDGRSGIVFDLTADALHKALEKLRSDRSRTREMGLESRKRAENHFSLEVQAEAVESIYTSLLSSNA